MIPRHVIEELLFCFVIPLPGLDEMSHLIMKPHKLTICSSNIVLLVFWNWLLIAFHHNQQNISPIQTTNIVKTSNGVCINSCSVVEASILFDVFLLPLPGYMLKSVTI